MFTNKQYWLPIGLSLLCALLLITAWPTSALTFIIFVAWYPALYLFTYVQKAYKFWFYIFIALLLWNIGTTWWIWESTAVGAIAAIFLNSLFMSWVWLFTFFIKRGLGLYTGLVALVICCLGFEWLHLNWELAWPWLNLGSVFAAKTNWVQWYEYTGTSGGSLWIWLVNIAVYFLLRTPFADKKKYAIKFLIIILAIALPILSSFLISVHKNIPSGNKNIVVLQPNIDSYTEKFAGADEAQIQYFIKKCEEQIDANTALVLWPETSITTYFNEANWQGNKLHDAVWAFVNKHPQINLLAGANSFRYLEPNEPKNKFAQKNNVGNWYYEYNSAIFIDTAKQLQVYHKSKLVPGIEIFPYIHIFGFLKKLVIDLGGGGLYATQAGRTVFGTKNGGYKVAPIICYESIFGDFVRQYVQNGANLLGIITNDGWWGNTAGHKQHLLYAKLRAIENRRPIARSANTGISAFIDEYGNISQGQPYNTAAVIKFSFNTNTRTTFYTKYGDVIYKLSGWLSLLLIIGWFGRFVYNKFNKKNK
jgi:apolipoprotein N-acyltransferase